MATEYRLRFPPDAGYNAETMKKLQTKDVGDLLGVTPARIRQLENEGQIHAERIGSTQTRVFDEADVKKLKAERDKQKR